MHGLKITTAAELSPIGLRDANAFVARFHRHCRPTWRNGGKFAIAAVADKAVVGVVIVGRPVARLLDDGKTAEVIRLCTSTEAPHGTCSMLYRAAWRAWRAMGGRKLVTYTLATEPGSSVKGAGFRVAAQVLGGYQWDRAGRHRRHADLFLKAKVRWEIA